MKNFKKISYIAIIFLIVCFSLISIFGFETRWGESLNTHFKGAKNLQWDGNFDDEAIITLNYEQNLNQNTKESVENILKKRLALAGFGENKIYFSKDKKTILVKLPYSYNKANFDFEDIGKYLAANGEVKAYNSKKNIFENLLQLDSKNDEKDLIFNNDNVNSVSLTYSKEERKKSKFSPKNKTAGIKFNLDEEKREKLNDMFDSTSEKRIKYFNLDSEIKVLDKSLSSKKENLESEENKEEKEALKKEIENDEKIINNKRTDLQNIEKEITQQNIDIKVDGASVYSGNILDLISEDNRQIIAVSNKGGSSNTLSYVNLINSGKMPIKMSLLKYYKNSPNFGFNFKNNMLIILLTLFLILVAISGIRFKLLSCLTAVTLIGHLGFVIACFTGFFSFMPGFCVNIFAIFGFILTILMGVYCLLFIFKKFQNNINEGKALHLTVKQIFEDGSYKNILKLNVVLIIIFAILMGVFAPENSLFYNILKPLNLILEFNPQNSIFSFSYAMFTGIIAIMLFETLLTKFILKTIIEFKFFRNNKLYGGRYENKKPNLEIWKLF